MTRLIRRPAVAAAMLLLVGAALTPAAEAGSAAADAGAKAELGQSSSDAAARAGEDSTTADSAFSLPLVPATQPFHTIELTRPGSPSEPPDSPAAPAQGPATAPAFGPGKAMDGEGNEFGEMDLKQLMEVDVQVTSVAGTSEDWFTTPAALTVIGGEDIQRWGFRSVPEALRMVPGMHVGRLNAHDWAISARGFNGLFANKLQVSFDGRKVYNPLFGGTFWDLHDPVIEDIARIEVVRGPGATLWGSNAVNGVVNVRTKSARDTQGLYTTGGYGTNKRGFGTARYGGQHGENTFYRVWGKYRNHDSFVEADGSEAHSDWAMAKSGLRLDHYGPDDAHLRVQGGAYHEPRRGEEVSYAVPTGHLARASTVNDGEATGAYLLAELERDDSDIGEGWSLKGYYDYSELIALDEGRKRRHTFDLEFRQHFTVAEAHKILWGVGARHSDIGFRNTANGTLRFTPSDRELTTLTAFFQDTITLEPERWKLIVGSKFGHNDFTGFEVQPSARLAWTPTERQTIWGAVSRPVRTPSIRDDGIRFKKAYADTGLSRGGPPSGRTVAITSKGNPNLEAETLIAYELGHRSRLTNTVTLDTTAFYNQYDELIGHEQTTPTTLLDQNRGQGRSYGVEVAARWRPGKKFRLESSYSFIHVDTESDTVREGTVPRHQAQLRLAYELTPRIRLNSGLYWVGEVPLHNIPSYTRLDAGMKWDVTENFQVSLQGQNLLDPAHPEYKEPLVYGRPNEVERGVYLEATYRF